MDALSRVLRQAAWVRLSRQNLGEPINSEVEDKKELVELISLSNRACCETQLYLIQFDFIESGNFEKSDMNLTEIQV